MTKLITELIRNSDAWILRLNGNVDSSTAHLMWSTAGSSNSLLKELLKAKIGQLFIDLTATEFIDSQGLRLLLNAHKEFTNQNVLITLQNPNSHLERLFRIMQFDRVFIIESTK